MDDQTRHSLLPTPSRRQKSPDYNVHTVLDSSIDSASRYRIGCPNPLPALPLTTSIPSGTSTECALDQQKWNAIRASVPDILQSKTLRWSSINYIRRHVEGTALNDEDNTIFIEATLDDKKLGIQVVEAILELVQTHGQKLRIKIADERVYETTFVANVERDVAQQWPAYRDAILGVLGHGPNGRL